MKKTLLFAMACLSFFPLKAGDPPKTLPQAIYNQLKPGKSLDRVWIDATYTKIKGFKVAPVTYKADYRSGEVLDSLTKAFATLNNADSPFTLKVAVVKVSTKTFTGFGNIMGSVTVEGQIQDESGRPVVCFLTKEKAGSFGGGKDDYSAASDKIASAIAKDLL